MRFSFSIKFDEKFDENEGVYACIDQAGLPAAIPEPPCLNRVGKDIEVVPENDDREFMGVEKVYFRYNRDDPSYQRELLAHTILNQIGVPTSRVAHASIELELTGSCNVNICAESQVFNMGIFQPLGGGIHETGTFLLRGVSPNSSEAGRLILMYIHQCVGFRR